MKWRGAAIRFVVAFVAIELFRYTFGNFPAIGVLPAIVVAFIIGAIGYIFDGMLGGYISTSGRSLIGLIVTTAVLSIYLTRFTYPYVHTYSYVSYAVMAGVFVAVGDLAAAKFIRRGTRLKSNG